MIGKAGQGPTWALSLKGKDVFGLELFPWSSHLERGIGDPDTDTVIGQATHGVSQTKAVMSRQETGRDKVRHIEKAELTHSPLSNHS